MLRRFWSQLGFVGKFLVILGALVVSYYALDYVGVNVRNLIPGRKAGQTSVPERQELPQLGETAAPAPTMPVVLPAAARANVGGPQVRAELWAWNAQMDALLANGGPFTTEGSLMAKYGVNLSIVRNDDTNNLRDKLVACATEMESTGNDDCVGEGTIHFMAIMGDQAEGFFANVNPKLRRLGSDYVLEVVDLPGKSHGEDQWMGPKEWRTNPQAARGGVVTVAVKEGDWNIVVYKAAQDNIPINPDVRTYNPNAINFIHAPTYTEAAVMFNSGYCESRPVVDDRGNRTGETKRVCADQSLSTWFPADNTAATGKGGVVRIWSTKENAAQMPNILIGIRKWNQAHRRTVENMIAAIHEAGDMIKSSDAALRKAAEVSVAVNCAKTCTSDERDWKFWYDGYRGFTVNDKQGNEVEIGGSMVFNLADALYFLGIEPWGSSDLFSATYTLFGNWLYKYYPEDFPARVPYNDIVDKSYIEAVAKRAPVTQTATLTRFRPSDEITGARTQRSWSINFEFGKATLTPAGERTLDEVYSLLAPATGVLVEVHGHTDDVGDSESNFELSMERARAVKNWLMNRDRVNFPDNRVRIQGFGESQPLVDATTASARAQNRRVEIITGGVGR